MSDRYIEKSFIFLLIFSLLLHVGVGVLLYYLPEAKPQPPKEAVFVDLQQVPELKAPEKPHQQEIPRQSDRRVRVPRETAPRGVDASNADVRRTPRTVTQNPPASQPSRQRQDSITALPREAPVTPGSSVSSLLKPKASATPSKSQAQLFPSAGRLAKLEDSYRRKFENDIAEGDTRFLNSDDIQFGSFLRRFENSVYGAWRYPQEAASKGIEGITPVRITFNRRGEIIATQLLESSGAKVLDDEVFRTLKLIGPVGGFPKGYDKDEFHLIAFFQYGGARRSLR